MLRRKDRREPRPSLVRPEYGQARDRLNRRADRGPPADPMRTDHATLVLQSTLRGNMQNPPTPPPESGATHQSPEQTLIVLHQAEYEALMTRNSYLLQV